MSEFTEKLHAKRCVRANTHMSEQLSVEDKITKTPAHFIARNLTGPVYQFISQNNSTVLEQ